MGERKLDSLVPPRNPWEFTDEEVKMYLNSKDGYRLHAIYRENITEEIVREAMSDNEYDSNEDEIMREQLIIKSKDAGVLNTRAMKGDYSSLSDN